MQSNAGVGDLRPCMSSAGETMCAARTGFHSTELHTKSLGVCAAGVSLCALGDRGDGVFGRCLLAVPARILWQRHR